MGVLTEQWDLSISRGLGVCRELCGIWEALNEKVTTPALHFLIDVIAIKRAVLSLTQRLLPPVSSATRPPSRPSIHVASPALALTLALIISGYKSRSSEPVCFVSGVFF